MFHRLLVLNQPATVALLHEWELFATYQAESFTLWEVKVLHVSA
jgi:hypothetical protein